MPISEQEWQEFRDRAQRAASKGAALLDRKQPEWFRKINTAHLRMMYCDKCILGQVFGNYREALLAVGIDRTMTDDAPYGFRVDDSDDMEFGPSTWMELARCWREEIRRREKGDG